MSQPAIPPLAPNPQLTERRRFMARLLGVPAAACLLPMVAGCGGGEGAIPPPRVGAGVFGALGAADSNGVRLPAGFSARVVARSGQAPVHGGAYSWPDAPDGGAVFEAADGGWVYVVNSEVSNAGGGAGALRFDAEARLVDAYPVLAGTSRNCAGGATPWSTWLSCEEVADGRVWECDPFGRTPARVRPALGVFNHEAVAVDPARGQLYLTEDRPDGLLYRFTPATMLAPGRADLTTGTLEVAEATGAVPASVIWHLLPDPSARTRATRFQVAAATRFDGGEGICEHQGVIYFTTKGDDRVWAYAIAASRLSLVYDAAAFDRPILTGVDNITVSTNGDLFVAEDGGDLQVVALTASGEVVPVLELTGHDASEVTGIAFDPSGRRLYFSSQRGSSGRSADGVTFEVSGPFAG